MSKIKRNEKYQQNGTWPRSDGLADLHEINRDIWTSAVNQRQPESLILSLYSQAANSRTASFVGKEFGGGGWWSQFNFK